MTKRILAMTLCLALTLLACACVASDVTVSAPENTDSKGGNTPDLSTMEQPGTSLPVMQMSSQPAFSDTVSKPTEPILPEEKETTLEKVLSFEIGEDGLFSYRFLAGEDKVPALSSPTAYCADENGNVFVDTVIDGQGAVVCLNTGKAFFYTSNDSVMDIASCDDKLYLLFFDGEMQVFSTNDDKSIPIRREQLEISSDDMFAFLNVGEKEPILTSFDGAFFTLDMAEIEDNLSPYRIEHDSGENGVTRKGATFVVSTQEEVEIKYASKENISYSLYRWTTTPQLFCTEVIYCSCDSNGNPLSRFRFYAAASGEVPCNIPSPYGNVTSYAGWHIELGEQSFDQVVSFDVVNGGENNYYLVVYYPEHGEIYRIHPGYSDVQFTTKETVDK